MKRYLLICLMFCFCLNSKSQKTDLLLPSSMDREQTIHHKAYSLSYNSSYVMPSWISYKVTKTQVNKFEKIKEKYISDPDVISRSATKKDYKEGGYVMAQLINFLDVAQDESAKLETYYMSNIVPMKQAFYNFIWLKSEDLIRLWNANTQGLYVVCGPILTDTPFLTIGDDKVTVPKRFYKAVYDPARQKAIGFIFVNGNASGSLKGYAVPIDAIEKETGIDLFPSLADSIELKIEADFNIEDWNFSVIK